MYVELADPLAELRVGSRGALAVAVPVVNAIMEENNHDISC